ERQLLHVRVTQLRCDRQPLTRWVHAPTARARRPPRRQTRAMATLRKICLLIATLLVLLAAWPSEGEARCAIQRLALQPLTPTGDPLPRGADIVIALRPSGFPRTNAVIGSVTIGTEGMAGGNLVVATPLAPGL